jgi:hypothetical protein
MTQDIKWDEIIKKEARGINDADLGEVQEVTSDSVITKKGLVDKERFYLPKDKVVRFDGHNLWLNISEEEADKYKRD